MGQKGLGYAALAAGLAATGVLTGVPASGATATCDGKAATIVGTSGDDVLTGTSGPDVIAGLTGDDRIDGLGGADLICGDDGADVIDGGGGADRIYGGLDRLDHNAAGSFLAGDVLAGGPGADWLDPGYDGRRVSYRQQPDTFSYAAARAGVTVDLRDTTTTPGLGSATGDGTDTLVLSERMRVVGSPYADQLTGSAGPDEIVGGAGSDVISAGDGNDHVFPDQESVTSDDPGNDVVRLGPGRDFASSLAGRDQIDAGRDDDRVEALSPDPTEVRLGSGDDYLSQTLVPGHAARMIGGTGTDLLMLYAGPYAQADPRPRLVVDAAAGAVTTPDGSGTMTGFEVYRLADAVPWRFRGSDRAESVWVIDGGGLNAAIGAGNDRVTGSPLDDRINGGPGRDTAYGREGSNTCRHVEAGPC
jgi:Ca2+-binding RTX toxin-like protein